MAILWHGMWHEMWHEAWEEATHFIHKERNNFTVSHADSSVLAVQVSQELIRMAILWHEMWHEALEEASRQYFGESNVEAMLNTLMPLHEMMHDNGPTTLKEIAFVQVCSSLFPVCQCSI